MSFKKIIIIQSSDTYKQEFLQYINIFTQNFILKVRISFSKWAFMTQQYQIYTDESCHKLKTSNNYNLIHMNNDKKLVILSWNDLRFSRSCWIHLLYSWTLTAFYWNCWRLLWCSVYQRLYRNAFPNVDYLFLNPAPRPFATEI